jgi:hypothetical protein
VGTPEYIPATEIPKIKQGLFQCRVNGQEHHYVCRFQHGKFINTKTDLPVEVDDYRIIGVVVK